MKIAVLSEFHGNLTTLAAALVALAEPGGVDQYGVVGYLAALGPDPAGADAGGRARPQLDHALWRSVKFISRYIQMPLSGL